MHHARISKVIPVKWHVQGTTKKLPEVLPNVLLAHPAQFCSAMDSSEDLISCREIHLQGSCQVSEFPKFIICFPQTGWGNFPWCFMHLCPSIGWELSSHTVSYNLWSASKYHLSSSEPLRNRACYLSVANIRLLLRIIVLASIGTVEHSEGTSNDTQRTKQWPSPLVWCLNSMSEWYVWLIMWFNYMLW